MKSKHTPGPWKASGNNYFLEVANENSEETVLSIKITLYRDRGDKLDSDCTGEENRANARLIAASPDMLEALKQVKDVLEGDGLIDVVDMHKVVNSVILKATGGQ